MSNAKLAGEIVVNGVSVPFEIVGDHTGSSIKLSLNGVVLAENAIVAGDTDETTYPIRLLGLSPIHIENKPDIATATPVELEAIQLILVRFDGTSMSRFLCDGVQLVIMVRNLLRRIGDQLLLGLLETQVRIDEAQVERAATTLPTN